MGLSIDQISTLYSKTCTVCGGHNNELPNLAAGHLDGILDKIAFDLFNHKETHGTIPPELYRHNAEKLMQGVFEGLGGKPSGYNDPRNSLAAYLEQNVHAFSAAKSLVQMRHFTNMMVRQDGSLREYTAFRNKVMSAGYTINNTHLQTEYNTAISSAQMAEQWSHFKANGTEWLEYSTAGDGNVRPEHALLDGFTAEITDSVWNTIYPPNAFNCRCHVVPGKAANANKVALANSGEDWAKKQYNIDPHFQNNCGTTKAVFDEATPIYKMGNREKQLLAVDHYNMPTVSKVLANNVFTKPAPASSATDANNWWDALSQKKGFIDIADPKGLAVRIDDEMVRHSLLDNHDNRWDFIKELPEVISNPDEVWTSKIKGKLDRVYIKYYDNILLAVRVDGATMRPYTIHDLSTLDATGKILNEAQAISLRKGALLYRKL